MFYVYFLAIEGGGSCKGQSTYIGATVDIDRRLRQHNKEIKGGAHATGIKVDQGEKWYRVCYVKNFPDWPAALQFEWRWKQLTRKLPVKMAPIERRKLALEQLLAMERPTTKAVAYSEWAVPPEVVWSMESTGYTDSDFVNLLNGTKPTLKVL